MPPQGPILDEVAEIPPPAPLILGRPGTVRWAVGVEAGLRSSTWRVHGVSKSTGGDDIYIGTRQTMHAVKLSLHDTDASGRPPAALLAFTGEFAKAQGLTQRRLATMGQRMSVGHRWRHELTIATPSTTFGTFAESPPLKSNETIQWWKPPPAPGQLAFHIYVGDPGYDTITLSNHVGDVVQMALTNGRALWVVAQCEPMPEGVGRAIENHVASLSADPKVVHSFTLIRKDEDSVPVLLDLASLFRPCEGNLRGRI
jgi:hypothetical protein